MAPAAFSGQYGACLTTGDADLYVEQHTSPWAGVLPEPLIICDSDLSKSR